jgi:hypothetical protein
MDFKNHKKYIDVCIEYALSYSQDELSNEFSAVIQKISARYPDSNSRPIKVQVYVNEYTSTPTNIIDGLWFFFGNRLTKKWSNKTFEEYYKEVKNEMISCYVPFREFTEQDFNDAMRLRVYQDALNIIAGRKIDIETTLSYSKFRKLTQIFKKITKPKL